MRRIGALVTAVTILALTATSSGQTGSPYTESYSYDALGRLQSVTHDQNNPNGSSYENFQYDAAGNRLQKQVAATSAAITAGAAVVAGGMLQYTVQLSGNLSASHTFTVQATPGANASASDFVTPASQVTIPANTTNPTNPTIIGVQTVNPGRYELTKQVVVSITPTDSSVAVTQGQATGSITNANPAPSFSVSVVQSSIYQNQAAQFEITETNASDVPHTIYYSTSDLTSTGGLSSGVGPNRDYDAVSSSVVFSPSPTPQTITVNVPAEVQQITGQIQFAFTISTGQLSNGATIGTATTTETILPGIVNPYVGDFSIAGVTVNEGQVATLTITRTGGNGTQTVNYRTCAIGTAPPNCTDDPTLAGRYDAVSAGSVTFTGTQSTATISINTHADAGWNPNQIFDVDLLSVTPGGTIDTPTAQVTIVDLQTPSVFTLYTDAADVLEGNPVHVTVTRASGSAPTTVSYQTADGTAVAGSNYTAASGTLSFPVGTNSQTITINTLDNGPQFPWQNQSPVSAYVDFSGDNGATFSPTAVATVTIDDMSTCVKSTLPTTAGSCFPGQVGTAYYTPATFCDGSTGFSAADFSGCIACSSAPAPTQTVNCSTINANWSGTATQTGVLACPSGTMSWPNAPDTSTCNKCSPTPAPTQSVNCSTINANWSGTATQTGVRACPSGTVTWPNAPNPSTCNQCSPTSTSQNVACSSINSNWSGTAVQSGTTVCPSGAVQWGAINESTCNQCSPTALSQNVACSSINSNWSGTATQTGTTVCPSGSQSWNAPNTSTCNQCTPSSQTYSVTCASVDPGTVGTAYITQTVSCPSGSTTNSTNTSGCSVPPPACPSTTYQTYSCAANSGIHCLSGLITYQTVAACNGSTTTTVYNSSCTWTPGCVE